MGLFNSIDAEILSIVNKTLVEVREIDKKVDQILALLQPVAITSSIVVRFKGDNIIVNNVLVFNVGQQSQASILPLLADGITPSGGVLSNVAYNFSDPSATVVLNADGLTATCTGVAASNGPITGTATCTVTDTDGVVSQWTQSFTIQTNAVPPQQLTQSVAVQFSAPTLAGGAAPALKQSNPVKKPLNE